MERRGNTGVSNTHGANSGTAATSINDLFNFEDATPVAAAPPSSRSTGSGVSSSSLSRASSSRGSPSSRPSKNTGSVRGGHVPTMEKLMDLGPAAPVRSEPLSQVQELAQSAGVMSEALKYVEERMSHQLRRDGTNAQSQERLQRLSQIFSPTSGPSAIMVAAYRHEVQHGVQRELRQSTRGTLGLAQAPEQPTKDEFVEELARLAAQWGMQKAAERLRPGVKSKVALEASQGSSARTLRLPEDVEARAVASGYVEKRRRDHRELHWAGQSVSAKTLTDAWKSDEAFQDLSLMRWLPVPRLERIADEVSEEQPPPPEESMEEECTQVPSSLLSEPDRLLEAWLLARLQSAQQRLGWGGADDEGLPPEQVGRVLRLGLSVYLTARLEAADRTARRRVGLSAAPHSRWLARLNPALPPPAYAILPSDLRAPVHSVSSHRLLGGRSQLKRVAY